MRYVLLVAAAATLLLATVAGPAQAAVSHEPVSSQIICQCGCAAVLKDCPHQDCGWGIPAKQYISEQLAAGRTTAELIDEYVAQNGEQVLAAPSKTGFGLAAWVTPFAVLIVAAVAVYYLIRGWALRRNEMVSEVARVEPELPADGLDRLDEELRRFD